MSGLTPQTSRSTFEQIICAGTVVHGTRNFTFNARHLALKNSHTFMQFGNRKWIKILLCQKRQRIAWLSCKKFVHIHCRKLARITDGVKIRLAKPFISCQSYACWG